MMGGTVRRFATSRERGSVRRVVALSAAAAVVGGSGVVAGVASAHLVPGTPGKDVHVGTDTDNASNPFIQPPGVTTQLHINNADVVFGRDNDDLLIGRRGNDTVVGGKGADILVGGPDQRNAATSSDVLLGDDGRDLALWAPGDANDAIVGDVGRDTVVMGPLLLDGTDLVLERFRKRSIPRADIAGQPGLTCQVILAPPDEQLGAQYLVRFRVDGAPVGSVRLKDVEWLVCPSRREGRAKVARLDGGPVALHARRLTELRGALVRAVVAPVP
jgi:RTX calcium-binding nonapeptide repeat (4 copies)